MFLADYDLRLAERLVQGVDLWINTPRPPWEACGTSGMKVLVNGGLNLSSRDGWWAEAYRPELGWALPDGSHRCRGRRRLYELLEREIVPAFYERDDAGIPPRWVNRVRASMSQLTPRFSANRALRQYVDEHYTRGAEAYAQRSADGAARATELVKARAELGAHWPLLRFDAVVIEQTPTGQHLSVAVYLDDADVDAIAVELYADGTDGGAPLRIPMRRGHPLVGFRGFTFEADLPSGRVPATFTPRLVPAIEGLSAPLEIPSIAWQR